MTSYPSFSNQTKMNLEFLKKLLAARAPSGAEGPIQKIVHEFLKPLAAVIETDLHGNLIAGLQPEAQPRIMLAGHCDQIGFLVKRIDADGFAYIDPLGGPDEAVLPGSHMTVETRHGPLEVIVGKKATHLQTSKEKDRVPTYKEMWIDLGARSREEAEELLAPGDSGTFTPRVTLLKNQRIASPALDNRAGLYVVLEAFRRCAEMKIAAGLFVASTVQEELGMRGAGTAAMHLKPDAAIVVDVTNASDDPGQTSKTAVPCCLGKGPTISLGPNTNPVLHRMLMDAAARSNIPHQLSPCGELEGNDAKAIQVAGRAVATASIGLPNRNMHTQVELCSLDDLDHAVRLIVEFLSAVTPETDFRPIRFD